MIRSVAISVRIAAVAALASSAALSHGQPARAEAVAATRPAASVLSSEASSVEAAGADKAKRRAAVARLIDRAASLDADVRPTVTSWFESTPDITADLLSVAAEPPNPAQVNDDTAARLRVQMLVVNAWVESATSRGLATSNWPVQPDALVAPWLAVGPREPQRAPARSTGRQVRNAAPGQADGGQPGQPGNARPVPVPASELLDITPSVALKHLLSPATAQAVMLAEVDLLADNGQFGEIAGRLNGVNSPADQDRAIGKVLGFWAIEFGSADSRADPNGGVNRRVLVTANSTQEANLDRLAKLASGLRAAIKRPVPAEPLLDALAAIQGRSSIYSLDAIRRVFGPPADLDDATLESLANRSRQNLQAAAKSLRQLDQKSSTSLIELISVGHDELATLIAESRPEVNRTSSRILLAKGASAFDQSEFQRTFRTEDDTWIAFRKASFASYATAIDRIVEEANGAVHSPQLTSAATEWFTRALGTADLLSIADGQVAFEEQLPLIRGKLISLGGDDGGARLLNRFALKLKRRGVGPAAAGERTGCAASG